eukprot:gene10117-20687_t
MAEAVVDEVMEPLIDTTDIVVLSLVVGVVLYMVAKKYVFGEDSERAEATRRAEKAMSNSNSNSTGSYDPSDFVAKMTTSHKTMVVFFGSQ